MQIVDQLSYSKHTLLVCIDCRINYIVKVIVFLLNIGVRSRINVPSLPLHILTLYFNLTLEWELLVAKQECSGSEIDKGKLPSVDDCASQCKGVASLFAFGTNDFGTDRCDNVDGCTCLCETSATEEGICNTESHNGYRLYKYLEGNYHILR